MKTEYIEREAALALLKDDREVCADSKEELKYIRADIRSLPAADVRPVVRGKWIIGDKYSDYRTERCSACGFVANRTYIKDIWSYCPNCGADMREVDDAI